MCLLPELIPASFAGFESGANTSALWLQVMGAVNGAAGAGWLLWARVVPAAIRALKWRPALPTGLAPTQLLRPAMAFYEEIEEELVTAGLQPLPVERAPRRLTI